MSITIRLIFRQLVSFIIIYCQGSFPLSDGGDGMQIGAESPYCLTHGYSCIEDIHIGLVRQTVLHDTSLNSFGLFHFFVMSKLQGVGFWQQKIAFCYWIAPNSIIIELVCVCI